MENQMNSILFHFHRWMILLPILLVVQSCSSQPGPTASTTTAVAGSRIEATQVTPTGDDPLERLLGMRSIRFDMTALQPDGTSQSVQAEIDSNGNMHLILTSPVSLPPDMPKDISTNLKLPEETELNIVNGKAYQPDEQNPAWMTTPMAEDYENTLSTLLHGPNGPGLWLDLLPAGSLKSAGSETVGGFEADKYTVDGTIHGQKITGNLWYASHVLVQVELHIPAALLDPARLAAQGERKITLKAQMANIPPVILPTPSAETDRPTPELQPTPGSTNNPLSTLSISERYPLPHITFEGLGLVTTPGKVWVGSVNGMVDILDAESGQVLKSIALFPDSTGMTPHPVFDLKYDGQHVWALTTLKRVDKPDTLFVINESNETVLKQFDVTEWDGDLDQNLGFSPGKIWLSHQLIDTQTFEVMDDVVHWGYFYAFDSKGWMWITGEWTFSDCNPNLWVINADDPAQHYPGWHLYKHGIVCGMPITSIGDLVWVVVSQQDSTDELWAYHSGGGEITVETQPAIMVPSPDATSIALLGDQDGLWMLAGDSGYLYEFDPISGALLNSLELYGAAERKMFSANIALGDHDLWISMSSQLWRISLK